MVDQSEDKDKVNGAPQPSAERPAEPQAEARKPVTVNITDIELEQLKKEIVEYKDKYQRALAEAENARKRLQKEKHELIQYALQNVFADFLAPIDHFENALGFSQQASEDVKQWALGFQMILGQFKDVLSNNGVVPYKSEGKQFDPHLHEAVEMVATDEVAPGTVVSESLTGYKMGERIIRPASVKVAKAHATAGKEENKKEEN